MKIIVPSLGEAAYAHAASVFSKLWEKITGTVLERTEDYGIDDDIVIIGSDAVNDALTDKMISGSWRYWRNYLAYP